MSKQTPQEFVLGLMAEGDPQAHELALAVIKYLGIEMPEADEPNDQPTLNKRYVTFTRTVTNVVRETTTVLLDDDRYVLVTDESSEDYELDDPDAVLDALWEALPTGHFTYTNKTLDNVDTDAWRVALSDEHGNEEQVLVVGEGA